MINKCKIIVFILGATVNFSASAASFNCEKAATPIENMICNNDALSSLDSSMASLYEAKKDKSLISSQRLWIKDVRNEATTVDELMIFYADRIKFLSNYSVSDKHNGKKNINIKNNGKLKIQDFTASYVTIEGMQYSTKYKDMNKSAYILKCTEIMMIDVMNIWKKSAIKNNQIADFSKYRDNIYTGLWNSTSDILESQFSDPRMRTACDLLTAGSR